MQPTNDVAGIDSEMKAPDENGSVDLERYRKLVRTFIDLVRTNDFHC